MPPTPIDDGSATSRDRALAGQVARLGDRLAAGETAGPDHLTEEDPLHAAELRRLLPALRLLGKLRPGGPAEPAAFAPGGDPLPVLGDFLLIREIGRGGMGIVYEAEQQSLHRRVAIKVLPSFSAADPERLRRFLGEAKAAAALRHPHIVPVFLVGEDQGIHYYAMQLVEGRTLAQVIRLGRSGIDSRSRSHDGTADQPPASCPTVQDAPCIEGEAGRTTTGGGPDSPGSCPRIEAPSTDVPGIPLRFSPRWIAELGRQAAEALHHAHGHGIVHRDVKPSNLLIDAEGRLWITDFGLARMPEGDASATGVVIGTLRYMSPEQIAGNPGGVDHRTDVYSLGATLYELLTLRPAHPDARRMELSRAAPRRTPARPRRIDPAIPRALETIVLKAMAPDRDLRYATAADLAEDLARYVAGRPILARPPGLLGRALRWAVGHRSRIAAVLLPSLCVLLILGATIAWRTAFVETYRRRISTAMTSARAHERASHWMRYCAQIRLAQQAIEAKRLENAQEILRGLAPRPGEEDLRGFEWSYLSRLSRRHVTLLSHHDAPIARLAVSDDGRLLVTGDTEGTLVLWDLAQGRERARARAHPGGVMGLGVYLEGRLLASWRGNLCPEELGEIKLWDPKTLRELARLPCPGYVPEIHFDGTNRRMRFVSWQELPELSPRFHAIQLEDDAGSVRPLEAEPDITAIACSPDRRVLASADVQGRIVLRDAATFAPFRELPGRAPMILALAFSHDASTLAASRPGRLAFWDVRAGKQIDEISHRWSPRASLYSFQLRFASDDRHLLAIDLNHMALKLIADPGTHPVPVDFEASTRDLDAEFSPNAQILATTGSWSPATLWSAATGRRAAEFTHAPSSSRSLVFAPGGGSLLLAGDDGWARQWHLQGHDPRDRREGHRGEVWSLAFSPGGDRLISSGDDHLIEVRDPRSGASSRTLAGHTSLVAGIAVSPDGVHLASAGFDRTVRIWDLRAGEPRVVLEGHEDKVRAVAFSPEGRTLVSAGSDHTVRLWDAEAWKIRHVFRGHRDVVLALAFDPKGRCVASSCDDGTVCGVDAATGEEAFRFHVPGRAYALAFAPDGTRLVASSDLGRITFWRPTGWTCESSLPASEQPIRAIAFSPDGRRIAAGTEQGRILLLDAQSGQLLLDLQGHPMRVNAVSFSPDGKMLASGSHDGSIRLWRSEED